MKNDHSFSLLRRILRAAAVLAAIAMVAVTSFTWPAANLAPRDLPVAVVGTAPVPAGAEPRHYPTEAAAVAAIRDRDVYGAIVASASGPRVLVAGAASPAVARLLRDHAAGAEVRDVVPALGDPSGTGLAAIVLPLTLMGVVTGALGAFLFSGRARLGWLLAGAGGAGLIASVMAGAVGALGGDWLPAAAALSLAVLAVAATVTALAARVRAPGIAATALLMVLVGNPWSGASSAPELLPEPAGVIGQLLPPGAAGSLLRSVAYFDGRGAGEPLAVLAVWALAGLIGVVLAARRAPHPVAAPATA